jgi:hypothetical protein
MPASFQFGATGDTWLMLLLILLIVLTVLAFGAGSG